MFKKGSFEIGATVYPVAIKVHRPLRVHVVIMATPRNGMQQEKMEEGAGVTISRLICSGRAAWGWAGVGRLLRNSIWFITC